MSRLLGIGVGVCLLFSLAPRVSAQGSVEYAPASGHMNVIPPTYVAPGAVGAPYVETFPSGVVANQAVVPGQVQQVAPYSYRATPVPRSAARGRAVRGTRTYSRGYAQPPAPYATPLPQGRLDWPGSYLTPYYVPFSRYQNYGSGYERGPYGSGFYGGYYKGYSMGW